jgi:AcrR family transcriptional regulator
MPVKGLSRQKASKSRTIDNIVEGAIRVFSQHGFEGGAFRDIAARAGVPLSTIHRYFPSKQLLYVEATQHIWSQINADRERLLNVALSESNGRPSLESVLHALAYPIVARAHNPETLPKVQLIANAALTRRQVRLSTTVMRRLPGRWLEGIMYACPALKRAQAVWAYSFVVGAIYSWQMLDGIYDHALRSQERLSAEEVSEALETFCAAGIRELESRAKQLQCQPPAKQMRRARNFRSRLEAEGKALPAS